MSTKENKKELNNFDVLSSIIDDIHDEKGKNAMMYILSINITLSIEQRIELVNKLLKKELKYV